MTSQRNLVRIFLISAISLPSLTHSLLAADTARPSRPNFIFINIDDMGYADIGPFGSKLNRTPNRLIRLKRTWLRAIDVV